MADSFKTFEAKDPDEKLDYIFDWASAANNSGLTDWLKGETIASSVVTVSPADGLVIDSIEQIYDDTAILVWVSGGTLGIDYTIYCKITTSANRIGVRRAILPIRKK